MKPLRAACVLSIPPQIYPNFKLQGARRRVYSKGFSLGCGCGDHQVFCECRGAFDYEYPEEVTLRYAFPVPPEQEVGYSLWMAGQQALKVILRKKKTTPSGER